ncbi:MAG: FadR/GntR family transcriptional regulator [Phyllobacterium sp.]
MPRPAARLSAVDRVVEQIRTLIGTRSLAVGDPLPTERELCAMFGASRNTIREALRVVKTYGFIDTQTKTGAVISDRSHEAIRELFAFQLQLSPASFLDVQSFRRIVEVGLGDQVLQSASDADFDALDAINCRILDATSAQEAADCDFAFHFALIELTGNRTLTETYRLLKPVISHVMTVGKKNASLLSETRRAHGEIIGAMRSRDRIAYAYLMSRHLEFARRFLEPSAAADAAAPTLQLVPPAPAEES